LHHSCPARESSAERYLTYAVRCTLHPLRTSDRVARKMLVLPHMIRSLATVILFVLAGAATPPATRPKGHMAEHLQSARDMQQAIADGRLSKARELAAWFANHPLDEEQPWRRYALALRGAALRIEKAREIEAAGAELGGFGSACASCHVAASVTPTFTYGPPPRELDDSFGARMERHQWAAARLWEGLIGPSEHEWLEGATVLATVGIGERMQEQAREAQTLHGPSERAQLYGRMMSTCAECHQRVRPYPVGLERKE